MCLYPHIQLKPPLHPYIGTDVPTASPVQPDDLSRYSIDRASPYLLAGRRHSNSKVNHPRPAICLWMRDSTLADWLGRPTKQGSLCSAACQTRCAGVVTRKWRMQDSPSWLHGLGAEGRVRISVPICDFTGLGFSPFRRVQFFFFLSKMFRKFELSLPG